MCKFKFTMRNQWWIDAGIGGFYNIAKNQELQTEYNLAVEKEPDGVSIQYNNEKELRNFLEICYDTLATKYWNVSTKKQIENPEAIFYDKSTNTLSLIPKRYPTPIPKQFTKPKSWRFLNKTDCIKYKDLNSELKEKVESFMKETGKKLWGSDKYLLFASPVCHQEITILPTEKKRNKICSVCGNYFSKCKAVSQPSYLLFASESAAKSFNSEIMHPDRICWECEYLSKFAVEAASYQKKDNDLFILQVVSPSLTKMVEVSGRIGASSAMRELDQEYYYTNIRRNEKTLIQHACQPYEFLWAFFCDSFSALKLEEDSLEQSDHDFLEELLEISLSQAPIQLVLLMTTEKGKTFLIKDYIIYSDVAYIFRLLNEIQRKGVNLAVLFLSLYNKGKKGMENHFRNRFFTRVLNKRTVLLEVEKFAFHASRGTQYPYLNDLLEFVKYYETMLEVNGMNKEQVEVAVNLGKSIVLQARSMLEGDAIKKVKGDLFSLRKTRTKADFLNELNRLQTRYELTVNNMVLDGMLEEVPFEEFKAYCALGALNMYNSISSSNRNKGGV